jgi:hypothetical protein
MEEITNAQFWSENLKGRDHMEEPGADILPKWILRIRLQDMGWIHSAPDTDEGRALVNTVMNIRVI